MHKHGTLRQAKGRSLQHYGDQPCKGPHTSLHGAKLRILVLGDQECVDLESLRVHEHARYWGMQEVPPQGGKLLQFQN